MAGGNKRVVINQRERVVSADGARFQSLLQQSWAELLSFLLDGESDEQQAGGVATRGTTNATPLRAHVANGLLFRPMIGSVDASVDEGVLLAVKPDSPASGDDSPLKLIQDPGVSTGTLALTPNTSGSRRVDVVECRRSADVVLETGLRDVFDPSTGLFTPTSVTKVVRDQLVYRLRVGTPGSGYPGNAQGWLPLAVCCVPNGATTWDDAVVWDVRPLVSDLRVPMASVSTQYPEPSPNQYALAESPDGAGATLQLSGHVELTFGSRRVGGDFTTTLDPGPLDLTDAELQEPGFTPAAGPAQVYLAFPFDLPRWCRYLPASAGTRVPGALRGMPVLSMRNGKLFGRPNAAITLPSALGFAGATTTDAVAAVPSAYGTFGNWGATMYGRTVHLPQGGGILLAPSATPAETTEYDVSAPDTFPGRAVALRVAARTTIEMPGGGSIQNFPTAYTMRAIGTGGANYVYSQGEEMSLVQYLTLQSTSVEQTFVVPLFPKLPSGNQTTRTLSLTLDLGALPPGTVVTSQLVQITGWEVGP
jgi:hypothetical protein